jgi:type I restriction enzyme S subunit
MGELLKTTIALPPLSEQRAIAHVLDTVQRAREATERVIAATRELKRSLMRHLFTYGPVPIQDADKVPLKETEIGLVPEDWRVLPLGALGQVTTGKTPPTKDKSSWDGTIPFITPGDLNGGIVRSTARTVTSKALGILKPLPAGAVLVSCIGTIGRVGLTDSSVSVSNQQINAVVPLATETDNWYLLYVLEHLGPLLRERARVTTVPILNKSNFQAIPIPCPPASDQTTIGRALSVVAAKVMAEEQRLQALTMLFHSLLRSLMTGELRVDHRVVGEKGNPA